jgi:hypothetical protein
LQHIGAVLSLAAFVQLSLTPVMLLIIVILFTHTIQSNVQKPSIPLQSFLRDRGLALGEVSGPHLAAQMMRRWRGGKGWAHVQKKVAVLQDLKRENVLWKKFLFPVCSPSSCLLQVVQGVAYNLQRKRSVGNCVQSSHGTTSRNCHEY